MAKKLLLIRHAATVSTGAGRFVGATDERIVAPAREETEAMRALVHSWAPDRILGSPMLRVRQTAALLLAEGGPLETDDDLREIDFGRWEGLTFAEMSERDPGLVDKWVAGGMDFCFPEGEEIAAFHERVRSAAGRLAAMPEETVLVLSHGGVIRSMICHFLGLSAGHYLQFDVKPFTMTVIRLFGDRGILSAMNLNCKGGTDV